ncbi:hypothetical protein I302_101471 [Kwoniella bestiolae CBS 10118]|uniref:D-aspartate oxidase n=1 Tax=Kwoniella bestiolae CBS 10118 TaxID=1296100 RepID=A0A1B9GCC7_9TREE|nr:D-aspartate oxidase [Kwoniella bestiolae CBS 10118]OCF28665.1 D-aspartate oxidase [Kwoniella bestiolae CBS 10118]
MPSDLNSPRPIVVLGAGIIGLTTAIRLLETPLYQEKHHPVHIIADHLPDDPLDPRYASTIAGAHHLSFADDGDERQRRWDRRTFKVMYDEWAREGESTGLMRIKQTELFVGHRQHLHIYEEHPDFQVMDPSQLPEGVDHAVKFTSLTMTPAIYLNRLLRRIHELSYGQVTIHRYHLPSLSHITDPSIQTMLGTSLTPLAIFVCVGSGAIDLGGVEDKSVYPTRGQIVKIRAPWVKEGMTRQVGQLNGGEGGERTYIIPRSSGEVVLGGTREVDDWETQPRDETTRNILRRVLEVCPNLLSSSADSTLTSDNKGSEQSSTEVAVKGREEKSRLESLIVDVLVGFRPSRQGGVRVERGHDLIFEEADHEGTKVVYNYGHGGAGWQSCWGTAEDAISIL